MHFFLFFLLAVPAHAADQPLWRALLHFPAHSSTSSAKPGEPFFLSPVGHKDPEAELEATRKYFAEKPEEAACRFPARALYLGKTAEGKSDWCERWQKWRQAIDARGAEIVFAAAFLSSPSSMYGHTLLKFVRGGRSSGEDLLDYTLNYGANTGTAVGFPYVWLGLTGGFSGNYATAPFYLKVREYNFVENRDFWIYSLKLTEEQLRLLVAHSWELRNVDFPYYFLHKNCSFYLLELLEVLHPGSDFTGSFPFWTIPVDTIRVLQAKDILGEPRYRASRYRRLKALRASLTSGEADLVEELAEKGESQALPPGRAPLLVDTAYELWRYRFDGKKAEDPNVERKLLAARAAQKAPPTPLVFSERPPELGHPTTRFGLAYGRNRQYGFAEISYRGALHDLLADPHGYEDYSELSMGDIRVRGEDGKIFLERFDILKLRSLAPRERWIPRSAWAFRGGFSRAKEFACRDWNCWSAGLEGGYGMAARLGPILGFTFLQGGFEAGKPFDRGYRLAAGPTAGIFSPLWPGARFLLEGDWRWRVMGSHLPQRAARLGLSQTFSPSFELRLQGEVARTYREGLAQVYYYF